MLAAISAARIGHSVVLLEKNEKLGKKIREANLDKIIYMITIGDQEVSEGTLSVRSRFEDNLGSMSVDDFAAKLDYDVKNYVKHSN